MKDEKECWTLEMDHIYDGGKRHLQLQCQMWRRMKPNYVSKMLTLHFLDAAQVFPALSV